MLGVPGARRKQRRFAVVTETAATSHRGRRSYARCLPHTGDRGAAAGRRAPEGVRAVDGRHRKPAARRGPVPSSVGRRRRRSMGADCGRHESSAGGQDRLVRHGARLEPLPARRRLRLADRKEVGLVPENGFHFRYSFASRGRNKLRRPSILAKIFARKHPKSSLLSLRFPLPSLSFSPLRTLNYYSKQVSKQWISK